MKSISLMYWTIWAINIGLLCVYTVYFATNPNQLKTYIRNSNKMSVSSTDQNQQSIIIHISSPVLKQTLLFISKCVHWIGWKSNPHGIVKYVAFARINVFGAPEKVCCTSVIDVILQFTIIQTTRNVPNDTVQYIRCICITTYQYMFDRLLSGHNISWIDTFVCNDSHSFVFVCGILIHL